MTYVVIKSITIISNVFQKSQYFYIVSLLNSCFAFRSVGI